MTDVFADPATHPHSPLRFTVQVGGNNISAAWAGGINGREVIDILLPRIPSILSPQGRFYLLVLEQNKLIGSKGKYYAAAALVC